MNARRGVALPVPGFLHLGMRFLFLLGIRENCFALTDYTTAEMIISVLDNGPIYQGTCQPIHVDHVSVTDNAIRNDNAGNIL